MKQRWLLALLSALALTAPLVVQAKVQEKLLDNGLKVLVKEDHRAPVIVSQVWYKVGSTYEHGGITGVSHVLEHMMFKGTKSLGPGEFSRLIAENGGEENAFTGPDYTGYYQMLEKRHLELSFRLEADRMRNLLLDPEEFKKELKVVQEERRMRTEDNPNALTYEQFKATAFTASTYQNPVIGWMNDLDNLTLDDLQQWYERWYAPNNAIVVVAGDVQADEVFALAEKHFGPLKPSELKADKPRIEPEQFGPREIVVRKPAKLPTLIMGYKTPVLRTAEDQDEVYALEMLAYILDGSDSSRFSKELVRGSQVAASVGAGYSPTMRNDYLFSFSGTPAEGYSIAQLREAIDEQIRKVKKELVSEQEMERIKAQITAAKVYELDSLYYQAMQIGTLETVGLDWSLADEYVERINAVTPEQIRAVANKYLVDDGLTVAILEPQSLDSEGEQ